MASSRRRRQPIWQSLFWWAGGAVALAGWSELLSKPLNSYRTDHDAWRVLTDLLRGQRIYEGIGESWLFLFLTAMLLIILWYFVVRTTARFNHYIEDSRTDISVLQTNIWISIDDPEMTTAWIARHQFFHANAADVNAYHYSHTPSVGHVELDSFMINTTIGGALWTDTQKTMPIPHGKGFELIEVFRAPLPSSRLATYLSDQTVLNLKRYWGWFGAVVAERNVSFKSVGEYNQPNPMFELQLMRYRAAAVRVWISFPIETAPDFEHLKAMRIRENAVHFFSPTYRPSAGRKVLHFSVDNAEHERIRVTWSNRNLRDYLARRGGPSAAQAQAAPPPP